MYPFPEAVNPALRTHIDAQTAFLNDVSKSVFHSFQQMCDLNIQLMQTLLEETTLAGKQMFTANRAPAMLGAAASRAQPITDKLRAYQQHISRLAADAQVELARVTEMHAQNTARTARALADEVARTATEETEREIRVQQESLRRFADPFASREGGEPQHQQTQQPQQPQQPQRQQPKIWTSETGATMQRSQQGTSQGGSHPAGGMARGESHTGGPSLADGTGGSGTGASQ